MKRNLGAIGGWVFGIVAIAIAIGSVACADGTASSGLSEASQLSMVARGAVNDRRHRHPTAANTAVSMMIPREMELEQAMVTDTHIITHHDHVPRVCAQPTVVAVRHGNWSEPQTWSTTEIPGAGAKVSIPVGRLVTYDQVSQVGIDCIEVAGSLIFGDRNATLYVTDMQILPGAYLEIGTLAAPISPQHRVEIVLRDTPLRVGTVGNPGLDPGQYLTSLLMWGRVRIHGTPMERTFIRLAKDAKAGSTTLHLQYPPHGWQSGDTIVIPDTRQVDPLDASYHPQWETRQIKAINGTEVRLNRRLSYAHLGPRDADRKRTPSVLADGTPLKPHVGNLSRNVIIRSENPKGTRGHTYFSSRADVDVRYAAWVDLGRTKAAPLDVTTYDKNGKVLHIGTNQIGRYPYHHHHLLGPRRAINFGYQFISLGNAIVGAGKWGMTIHGTHFGLIKDNVVHDVVGVGVATETGDEVGNVIQRNFVVGVRGGVNRGGRINGLGENRNVKIDFGELGDGFWFAGPFNTVIDNVVANARRTGYVVFPYRRQVSIPRFRGADSHRASETTQVDMWSRSLSGWLRNEVYGATTAAMTLWRLGNRRKFPDAESTIVKDQRVWHVPGIGMRFYYNPEYELDGWVQRNNPDMIQAHNLARGGGDGDGSMLTFAGARADRVYLRNFDGQGSQYGIINRGRGRAEWLVIENTGATPSLLRNYIGLAIRPWSFEPANGTRTTLIRDVVFDDLVHWYDASRPAKRKQWLQSRYIAMQWKTPKRANVFRHERTYVENYQSRPGENFQLFYEQQAPQFVIPEVKKSGRYDFPKCVGLTNAACWAQHGGAIAGEVAPCVEHGDPDCSKARKLAASLHIQGLAFRLDQPVPQPPRPEPTVKIAWPIDGQAIKQSEVLVEYYVGGDLHQVDHVHLQLGNREPVTDREQSGQHTFVGVEPGIYPLIVSLARADHSVIAHRTIQIKVEAQSVSVEGRGPGNHTGFRLERPKHSGG